MTRIANKVERLQAIEALLIDHPEGLTQTEIAARLGTHRIVISRNLPHVQAPIEVSAGHLL